MLDLLLSLLGSSTLGNWLVVGFLAVAALAGLRLKSVRDGVAKERARQSEATIRAHETRNEVTDETDRKDDAAVRDALAGWVSDKRPGP